MRAQAGRDSCPNARIPVASDDGHSLSIRSASSGDSQLHARLAAARVRRRSAPGGRAAVTSSDHLIGHAAGTLLLTLCADLPPRWRGVLASMCGYGREATAVRVSRCYRIEGMLRLPRLRHDRLGGSMQRGRALFWTITGSVAAVVAAVIALILVNSSAPPKAASSPTPSISASASSPAGESAPVVIPKTSSTSSFSYLSDMVPSGNLGELVDRGPVKIDGSVYPKSLLFYCNVGDPTAFPAYKLGDNARRFQATIALGAKFPPQFEAAAILVGDGHTLGTFVVSALRPKTVDIDVNVTGIHTLQLECFGSGQSLSAGFAISVAWGNARVVERN